MTKTHTYKIDIRDGEYKLKQLILHISRKCFFDRDFGISKLGAILWYSDFFSYAAHAKPITGVEYWRTHDGPMPKKLFSIREEMVEDGDAVLISDPRLLEYHLNYPKLRLIALRAPLYSALDALDIVICNDVIRADLQATNQKVSSGGYVQNWQCVKYDESIAYTENFDSEVGMDGIHGADTARARIIPKGIKD